MEIRFYKCRYDIYTNKYIKDTDILKIWKDCSICLHSEDWVCIEEVEYGVIQTVMYPDYVEVWVMPVYRQKNK